jgi:hypothetical protein
MSHIKSTGPVLHRRLFSFLGVRINRFLLNRLYLLLLLIPLFFIAYPLASPGIPITLDFPALDTSDYASGKLWAWTEKGSVPALETISRFPIIVSWYALGTLGIDSALISKFMIILGFFIASYSFYFSFLLLFKDRTVTKSPTNDTKLKIAAVIGAVFFAYNPWSFERIPHWYLWIGYAVLPLFFISIIYAFRNPRNLRYTASSIVLWSFASTTPHMTVFYGMIFVIVFAAFILNNIFAKVVKTKDVADMPFKNNNKKNSAILLLIPFLSIIFLYSLVNLYWIYPYVLASQIRSISPNYLLVQENLELLSRESNFLNTFGLVANWQEQPFEIPEEGTLFYHVWLFATLALPIFGFSAPIISRKFIKYTSIFSAFALIGIILAMGTQSPINYFKSVLENPILSNYGWLVRDPDKWGFLIAFTYSFLIGIASYKVLELTRGRRAGELHAGEGSGQQKIGKARNSNRKRILVSVFFLCLLIGSIGLYSYPVFVFNMLGELRPVPLPAEFNKLNNYLSDVETNNVYFLPYPLDETKWNKNNRVGNIYQTHSLKPSIESSGSTGMAGMGSTNYYNYITQSVNKNRSKDISNFIYPLGTSYIIFHNDTWDKRNNLPDIRNLELLKEINSLEGLENVRNIGFYNIFKVNNHDNNRDADREPQQITILNKNIAALGGLDVLQYLDSMPSFSSLDSSVFFVDEAGSADITDELLDNFDYLILGKSPSYYNLLFSLVDSKYIFEPSNVPINYDPMRLWSKAGAMDPDFGLFHPYLEHLGIDNWQFDYGKGLVITQAAGTNLSIPINVQETGQYDIFLRFLKNQRGGVINVYLDEKLLQHVNTLDPSSNEFVWQEVINSTSPTYLEEGKHTITLENVAGFNAVNTLGVIPFRQISELQKEISSIAKKSGNIYHLEAESSFYNNRGKPISGDNKTLHNPPSSIYYLSGANDTINNATTSKNDNLNSKLNRIFTGQIKVPKNADLLSLQLLAKDQNNYSNDSHSTSEKTLKGSKVDLIENLKVYPAIERRNIIESDFERNKVSIPLADLRKAYWVNHDENTLLTSLDTDNPISGNASLRVDVRQGNISKWSLISTDFIPINDKLYYNFDLDISARNVKQLHSKVTYFDEDRKRIGGDFISLGRDGTFQDAYSTSIVPPLAAKYLRFEMLVRPTATTQQASYLIDNMKFEETAPPAKSLENDLSSLKRINASSPAAFSSSSSSVFPLGVNKSMIIESDKSTNNNFFSNSSSAKVSEESYYQLFNGLLGSHSGTESNNSSTSLLVQTTKPTPVIEDRIYNFSIDLKGGQAEAASGESTKAGNSYVSNNSGHIVGVIAQFTNTSDVIENSVKYGQNASGGKVLALSPQSEIYADLDILKPDNYKIALRANTCEGCSFLTIAIKDKDNYEVIRTETVWLKEDRSDFNDIKSLSHENNINKKNEDHDSDLYDEGELKWLYLNRSIYLDAGKYEINIHSDSKSKVYLDSVVVYSNDADNKKDSPSTFEAAKKGDGTLDRVFSMGTKHPPAYLTEYNKINPTKYEVEIKNATRPYMLSLAETYDPLWMASYDITNRGTDDNDNNNFKISSIPLYSIINGFYLNKTGDYTLTIEYQPQKWFIQGAIISIITALSILIILLLSRKLHSFIRTVKLRY